MGRTYLFALIVCAAACSGEIAANNGDGGLIDAPTSGDYQLALDWVDNSDNESGFIVERRLESGGGFAEINRPGANAIHFDDFAVTLGTRYCYRVAAYNSAGRSAYTPEACAAGRAAN